MRCRATWGNIMRLARLVLAAAIAAFAGANILSKGQGSFVAQAAAAPAGDVSFNAFHDRLAPYGSWINHRKWGPVWRPNAGRGFRPYRDRGHWEDTADYGTVWVSDYAWGDIPFHYGRWFFDPALGWVWVPGYVWAPAWVIWRAGEGDVGWLPMPPWIAWDGYGPFPDDWDDAYGYASYGIGDDAFFGFWSFVDADDLFAPNIGYYVIGPRNYARFIRRTKPWTNFSILHGHLFNRSIDRDRFRAAFGHDPHFGRRHDFERHLGPITDYQGGKRIEAVERRAHHVLPATEMIHRPATFNRSTTVHVIRGGSENSHNSYFRTNSGTGAPSHLYRYERSYHAPVVHHTTTPTATHHLESPLHPGAPSGAAPHASAPGRAAHGTPPPQTPKPH